MSVDKVYVDDFPVLKALAERLAYLVPALVIAYPVLLWPLLYAEPVFDETGLKAPGGVSESYILSKVYMPPLFFLSLGCFLAVRQPVGRWMQALLGALVVFLGYCVVSTLWSLDPDHSMRRILLEILFCGAIVFSVMAVSQPEGILKPIYWLMLVVLAFNFISVATEGGGAIGHEGIYNHKNTHGNIVAVALVFCLYFSVYGSRLSRLAGVAAICVGLFLLFEARSKTAMAMTVLAPVMGLYLLVMCRVFRVSMLVTLLATTCVVVVVALSAGAMFDVHFGDALLLLFKDRTFTGRTYIWQFTLDHIQHKPWFGYGYAGFWDVGPSSPKYRAPNFIAKMPHAHNGYLNMALEVGLTGLVLLTAFVTVGLRAISRVSTKDAGLFFLLASVASYFLLLNLTETSVFTPMSVATSLFLVAVAVACGKLGSVAEPAYPGRGR